MTEPHHIVKFGVYRRKEGAAETAQPTPQTGAKPRANAYLALLAYMRRQKEIIKR